MYIILEESMGDIELRRQQWNDHRRTILHHLNSLARTPSFSNISGARNSPSESSPRRSTYGKLLLYWCLLVSLVLFHRSIQILTRHFLLYFSNRAESLRLYQDQNDPNKVEFTKALMFVINVHLVCVFFLDRSITNLALREIVNQVVYQPKTTNKEKKERKKKRKKKKRKEKKKERTKLPSYLLSLVFASRLFSF